MGVISSLLNKTHVVMDGPTHVQKPSTQRMACLSSDISFGIDQDPSAEPKCSITPNSDTMRAIQAASHHLTVLKVPVAIPTETVYGLAAPATDPGAVAQIFSIKGRPADNPLIVHVSSRRMLLSLLPPSYTISRTYEKLMKAFWPGPLTLLFPADPSKIPSIVTAGHPTVAIRMPSHPVSRAVISYSQVPLAAPSANSSGRPSPTKAEHVWSDLGETGKVALILDGGPCDVGVESTVVDGLTSGDGSIRVLRPGGVTVEEMQKVLARDLAEGEMAPRVLVHKRDYDDLEMEQHPTTPGMKYLHYSPSVPVLLLMQSPGSADGETLTDVVKDIVSERPDDSPALKIGTLFLSDSVFSGQVNTLDDVEIIKYDLGPRGSPLVAAQRLFDGLLKLEKEGAMYIFVEGIEETREGLAVMNRLRKAAREVKWIRSSP